MTSYYYCIDPVLKQAEKSEGVTALIPVSKEPLSCNGHGEDCFVLANPTHIMHLNSSESEQELAQLMKDVPLYHFNMELVLDEALAVRHGNKSVLKALEQAFDGETLPNTLSATDKSEDNVSGILRHPVLEHMPTERLAHIYINFLTNLERHKQDFSFQKNILGQHPDRFLAQFDGFFEADTGQIRSSILLAFGLRIDHDPHKPLESYLQSGQAEGRRKRITEPHELIWAWMECDSYQSRRCRDIHRVMSLQNLPRQPNWVRMDVFRFLEREATKQILAEKMAIVDTDLPILNGLPHLKKAIRMNAAGQVDENIQRLLAETINPGTLYSGAALSFVNTATERERESSRVKLGSA